jgi:AGCS family alanine or glycine:cation symporter
MDGADRVMGTINGWIASAFFFDLIFWNDALRLPFIVLWLVVGAIFLTLRMGFINVRAFWHAIHVTRGRYTNPNEPGDVSHFDALSTALSATVGLGNIAGVAIAITVGGPGATFWMIVAGLIGMTTKFTECTLGQMYREVRHDGHVLGGPVQYLSKGFAERGMPGTGRFLAVFFALLCIGGSLGGGNAFQVNQSMNAIQETVPWLTSAPWAYGLGMTVLVGIVIVGGIRRIAGVADKVVPLMAFVYMAAALVVILSNLDQVPGALAAIVTQAFAPEAAYGGFVGTLVTGFQRAAFSNEAGALGRENKIPGTRGYCRAARTVHRHRRHLHDDGASHQHFRRLQQPRLRGSDHRCERRGAHVACLRRAHHLVPVRALGVRVFVRVLDDDFLVVLR